MARKKGADVDTRKMLLDALLELSTVTSFDAVSVDSIVAKAGLSKGTFFHFFPTKQDALEAACRLLADEAWAAVSRLLAGRGDPLKRLARYLTEGRRLRVAHAARVSALWDALARDENARVRASVRRCHRERVGPSIVRILEEGTRSGQLQVADPEITAHLLLEFADASADETMRILRDGGEPALERAERRANATLLAIERMLRAPDGSFERIARQTLRTFALRPERTPP